MKKYSIILIFLLIISLGARGQIIQTGAGLSYNTGFYFNEEEFDDHKTGNPVLTLTGIYRISVPLRLKASLNVFMPNITRFESATYSEKTTVSALSLDMDAHYIFNYLDRVELYGLAGLNMLFVKRKFKFEGFDISEPQVSASRNNAMGLNLGAGASFQLKEEFDLFFELKGILGRQIQLVATAGILLNVDWMKEHENREL